MFLPFLSQPPGGGPGPHPMLPNMDPNRPQGADESRSFMFLCFSVTYCVLFPSEGHPNLGPMQRMSGPRGMGPMGPGPQASDITNNCFIMSELKT